MRKLHPYTLLGMLFTFRIGVIVWAAIAYGWQLGIILFLLFMMNELTLRK